MLIHDILELDPDIEIYFIEESYASLKNNNLSLHYLENICQAPPEIVNGIEDENGEIIGLVLFNPETEETPPFWAVFTNLVSSIHGPNKESEIFSSAAGALELNRRFKTTRKDLNHAIMEYYSLALVERKLCDNCISALEPYEMVYIESRNSRLKEILDKYELQGDMLEICCGNGMSTLPLHDKGFVPLTVDNDKCQICQGLEHKVLDPRRTIVLDATRLSDFFPENTFDVITGFMMGTIYPFNSDIWKRMMVESVKVLRTGGKILLTVNKKEELEILKNALEKAGVKGEMVDNTDDGGIYDQWIYVGTRAD